MAANEDDDGLFDLQLIIDPKIFSQSGLLLWFRPLVAALHRGATLIAFRMLPE